MMGYNYATTVFDLNPVIETDTINKLIRISFPTFDNAPVYYTLDGSTPTTSSLNYDSPVEIKSSCVIKAVAIREDRTSKIYSRSFDFNKATFKKITLLTNPSPRYTFKGAFTLVDGMKGGKRFASGEWLGFIKTDFEAIVDLEKQTQISEVTISNFIDIFSWISGIREYTVSLSDDNKNYKQVFNEKYPPFPVGQQVEIKQVTASFAPQQTRYVKIAAKTDKTLPEWSDGKGNPAFIFIDEIAIN